jgi:hypothetical protein
VDVSVVSDVEDPTFSNQSAHRWRLGYQPYEPTALYSQEVLLVRISVRDSVNATTIARLEGLSKMEKKSMILSRIEPSTFRLVA